MKYINRYIIKYNEFIKNNNKSITICIKIAIILSLNIFVIKNKLIFNNNSNINKIIIIYYIKNDIFIMEL